jgi:hypothetical protein
METKLINMGMTVPSWETFRPTKVSLYIRDADEAINTSSFMDGLISIHLWRQCYKGAASNVANISTINKSQISPWYTALMET